ncbi:MAG: O-antigen ligase family protein [Bacilli bacterium]|nr:O-antigen ligase family protein [Bacilli bacterium]
MLKKKTINIPKIVMYLIVAILLFQESLCLMFNIGFLKLFDEIFIIVLVISMIATVLKRKKIPKNTSVFIFIMICFCFLGIISCLINSNYNIKNLLMATFTANKFILLTISLMIIFVSEKIRLYFISSLKFWGWVVLLIGIFNFVFPNIYSKIFTFATIVYRKGFVSVTSLFFHAGFFGWFMLLLAIIYYSEYLITKKGEDKRYTLIFLVASLFSFKTKVFIAILAIVLFEMIFRYKIDIKKILLAVMISFMILFIFKEQLLYTYDTYIAESDTVTARQSLNDNGIRIMKEYFPLGVGFGKYGSWEARVNYSEYYYKYGMTKIYGLYPNMPFFATDTFWPAIIGETGFLGLIVYVIYIFKLYFLLRKKSTTINDNLSFIYCTIAGLALIQTVCESFGAPSFNSNPQNIILGILVGLALNSFKKDVDNHEKNSIYNS